MPQSLSLAPEHADPFAMEEDGLPYFSYAAPDDGLIKRQLIQVIERLTGQPRLKAMYLENRRAPREGESFWAAAIRHLELTIRCNEAGLARIPREGPLVVVANHPYGVLDGIVLSYLLSTQRSEFKILTNSVLYRAPELRPFLLPVDFSETREAVATNLRTRAESRQILKAGGTIVIFPGGTVSTAPTLFGRAEDPEWKPFTGRLVLESQATVVPVHFQGQNSRLFQIASHISPTLRIALLFKEVADRIGTDIGLTVGAPIPFTDLQSMTDRRALTEHLRALTYALGEAPPPAA